MNNIDFSTDKAVIVYALQGDGGKFLTALLGLSDSSMLMSNRNTDDVAAPDFVISESLDEKFKVLGAALQNAQDTKMWRDFNIYTYECFGEFNKTYGLGFPNAPELLPFPKIVEDIVKSKQYFFMCVHTPMALRRLLEIWKNAKLVVLTHSQKFIFQYRNNKVTHSELYGKMLNELTNLNWDQIRGDDYQLYPPKNAKELLKNKTVLVNDFGTEFFETTLEKFKYADMFESKLYEYFDSLKNENKLCFFDGDALTDHNSLIEDLKKVYKFLNLKDIDFDSIKNLHEVWLQTISTVNYPCD